MIAPLADGRELIYFDRAEGADRGAADTRPLPERAPASDLRHDPVLDDR